jgi:hypothetical protein
MTIGYLLFFGMKSGTYSTQIDVGGATSYTVMGLAAARTYYFTVRGRSAAGVLSAPAAEVMGTTPGISSTTSNAGDFNHDDVQDLLFQSTAGDLYAWCMNGTSFVSGAWLSSTRLDPEWGVMAARDFAGDRRPDLLLQNQSSRIHEESPDSQPRHGRRTGPADCPQLPVDDRRQRRPHADGYPDIVWQNVTAGQVLRVVHEAERWPRRICRCRGRVQRRLPPRGESTGHHARLDGDGSSDLV